MPGHGVTLMQDMPRRYYDFLAIADIACWCICFWWMHRIYKPTGCRARSIAKTSRTNRKISTEQHAILTEVHPNVESIQKTVDEVSDDVARVKGKVEKQL